MTKQVGGYVWTSLPADVKGNAERWTPSRMCRNIDDSIVQNIQDHDMVAFSFFSFFFQSSSYPRGRQEIMTVICTVICARLINFFLTADIIRAYPFAIRISTRFTCT